jgi:hypothetical protein
VGRDAATPRPTESRPSVEGRGILPVIGMTGGASGLGLDVGLLVCFRGAVLVLDWIAANPQNSNAQGEFLLRLIGTRDVRAEVIEQRERRPELDLHLDRFPAEIVVVLHD